MLKKLFIAALCLCSFSLYAQDKSGHINTAEIFNIMPEKAVAEKTLEDLSKKYENDINGIQEEYKKKYQSFATEQDSLPETIKVRRMTELQELQQRLENYQQTAYQDLQKKNQELQAPIIDKLRKAIQEVGDENGLLHIFDSSNPAFLYLSPTKTTDVMPLVKKKLGLL